MKFKKEHNWVKKFGGGGGGGSPPPPPIPPDPTQWLYDRSGNPVQLVSSGTYSRKPGTDPQDGQFVLKSTVGPSVRYVGTGPKGQAGYVSDSIAAAANNSNALYLSPTAAAAANPQMYLYDSKGNTTRQIFNSDYNLSVTAGTQDSLLNPGENFGPQNTPYQHIYDKYGVDQGYQPVSTGIPDDMYASSEMAPLSADYIAPTDLSKTDPALQPGVTAAAPDIAAAQAQTLARQKSSQAAAASLLNNPTNPNDTTGGTGGNNTLVGG